MIKGVMYMVERKLALHLGRKEVRKMRGGRGEW